MKLKALVLNGDYTPISVCSVQRAFLLIYLSKAELVKANTTYDLHTVNDTYSMPAVIKLNRYVNVPYKGVVLSRDNVFKRDGFKCQQRSRDRELDAGPEQRHTGTGPGLPQPFHNSRGRSRGHAPR